MAGVAALRWADLGLTTLPSGVWAGIPDGPLEATVDITPALALPGDVVDVLVMATNSSSEPLDDVWLTMTLPPGFAADDVAPPPGLPAEVSMIDGCVVVSCLIPRLDRRSSTALDVTLTAPRLSGTHRLTAFVRSAEDPEAGHTVVHSLPVV